MSVDVQRALRLATVLFSILAGPATQAADAPVPAPQPVLPGMAETGSGADYVPQSGVLREIGQRQTELAILELDIRKAELKKKLKDLDGGGAPLPVPSIPSPVPVLDGGPGPARPAPGAGAFGAPGAPSLRRIHKIGHDLAALLVFPTGEIRDVRRGASLPNDLKVVDILPDAVLVRRGDQPAYALPVSAGF